MQTLSLNFIIKRPPAYAKQSCPKHYAMKVYGGVDV
jgi:hypothetical protein